jgi:hypothetical protein
VEWIRRIRLLLEGDDLGSIDAAGAAARGWRADMDAPPLERGEAAERRARLRARLDTMRRRGYTETV